MKALKTILSVITYIVSIFTVYAQGVVISTGARIVVVSNAKIEIINCNFNNNGSFIMGNGTVTFSGTTTDSIKGTSNNDFYNLTVNNVNGVTNASTRYVAINKLLTFSTGLFNTDNNFITINHNATVTGAGINKYINGNCRKVGNDAFIFPVGKSGKYAPIGISSPQDHADHFTAAYFVADPNSIHDASLLDASLNKISRLEYWVLNRTNGNSNVKVTLSWDNTSRVSQLNDLRVTRWLFDKWIDKGNAATTGNITTGTITATANATIFSDVYDNLFTLGSSTTSNPLPVDLLYFKADCNNSKVNINWSTASETNCDYFIIEKMYEGESFSQIAKVNGSGNSNQIINYEIEDFNSKSQVAYYRLTQVDYSGLTEIMNDKIVSSSCNEIQNELNVFQDYDGLNIVVNSNTVEPVLISIFDLSGKLISTIARTLNERENIININDFKLAEGMYIINLQTVDYNKSAKVMVK